MPSRRTLANAIRALAMDAVQRAGSGHPGMPMGMADIAEVLWNDFLRHNPADPTWVDRDRFVVSNGHGSMLLYALLHLAGYDLPIEELKRFRQLHSRTPGHPEYGITPGVETTTGPLGQGLSNAVGMALAESMLAARFNRPGHTIVDHHTYVFMGDGCLMEGISHEVCSLAGHLGLGKLIGFYDDNGISIDGEVRGWFSDDTPARFEAYGWHVIADVDGHDAQAVKTAIEQARAVTERPSLLCCKTIIGWGSPNKQGREESHGAALGDDEVALVRNNIDWPHAPFVIPDDIHAAWNARSNGARAQHDWKARFADYRAAHPTLAGEFERRLARRLPDDWSRSAAAYIKAAHEQAQAMPSRKSSQEALTAYAPVLPELVGGSADLTGSNNTLWSGASTFSHEDRNGNYIYYGVREFGMSAIMNGLALHGGFIPYGGTFLTFSDYARNALRMASLMKIQTLFVYTHDSIGLGEDGPTHQAVEHAACLRLMPGMSLWRPCDAVESAVAWKQAIERRDGPTCLLFSRQGVPHQTRDGEQIANIARGGYVLRDSHVDRKGAPDVILIATGSEVGVAVQAAARLAEPGRRVRVVSMPCTDVFDAQDPAYRETVLPAAVTARVAVEAGVTPFWRKYVGDKGRIVGIDRFGESAPGDVVMRYFGITAENVAMVAEQILSER
ncbi:MAG: transketolase [Gammaproteobacteria bacterium]